MTTAAIYIRVSTDEQTAGTSLDSQRDLCARYAATHNYRVGQLYADEGVSGRNADRPAFQRLLADARARRFEVVLVYKLDRFARATRLALESMEALERAGVRVESVTEYLDRTSAAGNFNTTVMLGAAQLFSDMLSERMRTALAHKAGHGLWVGPTPYGCRVVDGVLTATEQIAVVAQAWQLYASGVESYTSIADQLNGAGHRTQGGQLFGRESVRSLLKNRAYLGYVSAGGQEYPGQHGALFADAAALYARNQELMARRTSAPTTRRPTLPESWLTGLCYCEACYQAGQQGTRLWHHSSATKGGRINRYLRCSGHDHRAHPDARLIQLGPVEDAVRAALGGLTLPADLLPQIIARAEALQRPAAPAPTISPAQVAAQIERLGEAYADGAISRERYQQRLAALRQQLAEVQAATPPLSFDLQRALGLLAELPALLAAATPAELRRIAAAVVVQVWVDRSGVTAIAPRADLWALLAARSEMCSDVWRVPDGLPSGALHLAPAIALRRAAA